MSLMFWKKQTDATQHTVVSESTPLPVRAYKDDGEDAVQDVKVVQAYLPPIAGQTITRMIKVPGIGTASAYAAGDAFGTMITFRNVFRSEKSSGTVVDVVLHDLDDEGIQVDVPLFIRPFTVTADNAAYAPSDDDNLSCRKVLSITEFYNWGNNQIGQYSGTPKWIKGESEHLYTQLVVQGAANIAAGAEPWIEITVVPD